MRNDKPENSKRNWSEIEEVLLIELKQYCIPKYNVYDCINALIIQLKYIEKIAFLPAISKREKPIKVEIDKLVDLGNSISKTTERFSKLSIESRNKLNGLTSWRFSDLFTQEQNRYKNVDVDELLQIFLEQVAFLKEETEKAYSSNYQAKALQEIRSALLFDEGINKYFYDEQLRNVAIIASATLFKIDQESMSRTFDRLKIS